MRTHSMHYLRGSGACGGTRGTSCRRWRTRRPPRTWRPTCCARHPAAARAASTAGQRAWRDEARRVARGFSRSAVAFRSSRFPLRGFIAGHTSGLFAGVRGGRRFVSQKIIPTIMLQKNGRDCGFYNGCLTWCSGTWGGYPDLVDARTRLGEIEREKNEFPRKSG